MQPNRTNEPEILVQYLVGETATQRLSTLYEQASQNISVSFSQNEQRLWEACMKRSWILPYVDAWLGFREPEHLVRRKIFIMLALLETQPDYSRFFIPSRYSFLHLINFSLTFLKAIAKIAAGRLITWII